MAFWDYHAQGGPSFVGLTDERLASVRRDYPRGRVIESVHHLPRVPGDDETDHIMRHRYGVDPASYGAGISQRPMDEAAAVALAYGRKPSKSGRSGRSGRSERRAVAPIPPSPRSGRSGRSGRSSLPAPSLSLSKLVKLALRESPSLSASLDRLIAAHLKSRKATSERSFIGLPLTVSTTTRGVRVRFAHER